MILEDETFELFAWAPKTPDGAYKLTQFHTTIFLEVCYEPDPTVGVTKTHTRHTSCSIAVKEDF